MSYISEAWEAVQRDDARALEVNRSDKAAFRAGFEAAARLVRSKLTEPIIDAARLTAINLITAEILEECQRECQRERS